MSFENLSAPPLSDGTYRWIPTMDINPGMVVARPVLGGFGDRMTLYIAVGSTISANTIAQLINRGVECIAVYQDIPVDEAAYADEVQNHEKRLSEIFGMQPNESCLQLMRALQTKGPSKC